MSNLERNFKRIDNILLEEAGTSGPNDYIIQISWILFLKYLSDLEEIRKIESELAKKKYRQLLKEEFQWKTWAVSENADSGDDLLDFVNKKLFPYLKTFKETESNARTISYKIGEIFSEIANKIQNGHNLREIIDIIDELEFKTQEELDDLSHLYEARLKLLGGAGRSGEFYTPRPLIKTIIKVINPQKDKTIYDGAAGTGGFLTEGYEFIRSNKKLSTKDLEFLKKETFFGKNKKPEPYLLGTMNMILHGIEAPNMIRTNTLTENVNDIQEKDKYDYIFANPPFGGRERKEVQQNFNIKTSETAFLFLQHFMKKLKAGGEAGVVIKNTFLSNMDNAAISLRKELLENYNLHTVLDLPAGVFSSGAGTGVKTVVLFFKKGEPTRKIWFYQLNLERNLGKTNPLSEDDLAEFVRLYPTKATGDNSWTVEMKDIDSTNFDLSVKNPNKKEENILRSPKEILKEMERLGESGKFLTQTLDYIEKGSKVKRKKMRSISEELSLVSIPVVASAGCDDVSVFAEENIENYFDIDKSFIPDRVSIEDVVLVRAVGDSMEEANIKNNDLVLVEKLHSRQAKDNERVVAIIDSKAVIKRVNFTKNAVILSPESKNKIYKPIIIKDNFNIPARVINVIDTNSEDSELKYQRIEGQ
ncbi:MAG TPA: N-6 DNA methylase [Candidatus Moranbacteria bacterium]|nr:N-6 DNA methylase [Candidatus Moranbacteria bacterium]